MDFIQNVGQSYLERKAFAAPQMAENMVMKQFKGSDEKNEDDARSKTAASHVGSSHSHSHAPASKKGSTAVPYYDKKDAEIKSLRKQLDHYSLEEASQGHHDSEGERGSSVGAKSRHVAPSYVSTTPHQHKPSRAESRKRSASEKPRRSSGAVYLEKGGLSRKKSSSRKPSSPRHKESGAAKEAAKLVALDARLEKGGISTKKKSQAFAEVEEVEPVRHGSRYHSVSESESESESDSEDDDVRSHHTSRSKATVSDASTVRASRVAPSHRSSHSRGRAIEIVSPPASHAPSVISSHHAPSHHSHHDSHSRAPVSIVSSHAPPSHRDSHAPSYHHGAAHSPSHAAPLATITNSRAPSHVHSSRAPPSILSSQAGSHHTTASPIVIAPRHSKSHTPSYYHPKSSHSASHAAPATIISAHSHTPSSSHTHHSKAPSSHHSKAPSSHHISHAHAPRSHVSTIHVPSTRSPSPPPSDSDSDSLAPSDSITSIDIPSEHGGSAALLHQREKYHRSASRGRVPELPPLEERPECCGPGFVPCRLHRERLEEDEERGGIVEVEAWNRAS